MLEASSQRENFVWFGFDLAYSKGDNWQCLVWCHWSGSLKGLGLAPWSTFISSHMKLSITSPKRFERLQICVVLESKYLDRIFLCKSNKKRFGPSVTLLGKPLMKLFCSTTILWSLISLVRSYSNGRGVWSFCAIAKRFWQRFMELALRRSNP